LDFRQWWLVRAARLGWRLSLKLGLGVFELILMGALGIRELRRRFRELERG
jgi:hypothetical protein